VFVDPPFPLSRDTAIDSAFDRMMTKISNKVDSGAMVIIRHEKKTVLLDTYCDLHTTDLRTYGGMSITFMEKK